MGIFKRKSETDAGSPTSATDDLSTLLLQGEEMIDQVAEAHSSWGLGSADRWDLDQQSGLIAWTFPDKTATAPAQILGSFNGEAGTWVWAWANDSILPPMGKAARAFRDWALANGHGHLASDDEIEADDETAATLATIAFRVTRATGFYRAPSGPTTVFITFGDVTLIPQDGEPSSFTINIDS